MEKEHEEVCLNCRGVAHCFESCDSPYTVNDPLPFSWESSMSQYTVQKSGLGGKEWKDVAKVFDKDVALTILEKQLRLYSVGQFRVIDENDKVIQVGERKLFS